MTELALQINLLHDQAMEHTDLALAAQRRDDIQESLSQFKMAAGFEIQAAQLSPFIEPTRSVLHRSAASLCMDCGNITEAERLIAAAKEGNPPAEILSELNDIQETIDAIRCGLAEAQRGDLHDISTLWDDIDNESESGP